MQIQSQNQSQNQNQSQSRQWNSILRVSVSVLVVAAAGWLFSWFSQRESLPHSSPRPQSTKAIVLPHHDLLLDQFPSFYGLFTQEDRQRVDRIILLSPNHFSPESLSPTGRSEDFVLGDQKLAIDTAELARLVREAGVIERNELFQKEHGILLHLPFIAESFPQAELIPLLLSRHIPRSHLMALIDELRPLFAREGTLLIASIDFSHYLPADEAWKKDETTLALTQSHSTEGILLLSDDYLDCPACLAVVLELVKNEEYAQEMLFHANSANFLPPGEAPMTTSYFVFRWSQPS